jgi:hypothetical protein
VAAEAAGDLRLLRIELETMIALSPTGRILRESPPDGSEGPRLFFGGCAGGNVAAVRHDLDDEIARRAEALAAAEPPWFDIETLPACLDALIALVSGETLAQAATPALIYRLPNSLTYATDAVIVRSDQPEGVALLERLAREGMPPHLVEAGFVGLEDFWAPWCAALIGAEIAALAFAVRLGGRGAEKGAEIGVYTFPGFRGRGLAAAVTAAWSALPELADRTLFYSTHKTNVSSRRVAARLGLRQFGVSISLR